MTENHRAYRHGRGSDAEHKADQALFHKLLERHTELKRETEKLPNGITVRTTSDNPELVKVLIEHVEGMKRRFGKGRAVRSWDPLFAALFEYRDQIKMEYHPIENGVEAKLTAEDPKLVELIYAHDKTLHGFVNEGFEAGRRESPVPDWLK
ncbi:hypothetical protein [Galenea microaerophila]